MSRDLGPGGAQHRGRRRRCGLPGAPVRRGPSHPIRLRHPSTPAAATASTTISPPPPPTSTVPSTPPRRSAHRAQHHHDLHRAPSTPHDDRAGDPRPLCRPRPRPPWQRSRSPAGWRGRGGAGPDPGRDQRPGRVRDHRRRQRAASADAAAAIAELGIPVSLFLVNGPISAGADYFAGLPGAVVAVAHPDPPRPAHAVARPASSGRSARNAETIVAAFGRYPVLFRPPYGKLRRQHALGPPPTCGHGPPSSCGEVVVDHGRVRHRTVAQLRPGDIVLFHFEDGLGDSLRMFAQQVQAAGLRTRPARGLPGPLIRLGSPPAAGHGRGGRAGGGDRHRGGQRARPGTPASARSTPPASPPGWCSPPRRGRAEAGAASVVGGADRGGHGWCPRVGGGGAVVSGGGSVGCGSRRAAARPPWP